MSGGFPVRVGQGDFQLFPLDLSMMSMMDRTWKLYLLCTISIWVNEEEKQLWPSMD